MNCLQQEFGVIAINLDHSLIILIFKLFILRLLAHFQFFLFSLTIIFTQMRTTKTLIIFWLFSLLLANVAQAEQVGIEPQVAKQVQRVFDMFPYDGEDTLLHLKLEVMSAYINYFVIAQGAYDPRGNLKGLQFNRLQFLKFQHQIIYLPVRSFPHIGENLSEEQTQENKLFLISAFSSISSLIIGQNDILIFSSVGDIIKQSAISQFRTSQHIVSCTQKVFFYKYFNLKLALNQNQNTRNITKISNGAKIMRSTYFVSKTAEQFYKDFYGNQCAQSFSQVGNNASKVIADAGWSLVQTPLKIFQEAFELKDKSPVFIKVGFGELNLPSVLIQDIKSQGTKSIYLKLFVNLSVSDLANDQTQTLSQSDTENNPSSQTVPSSVFWQSTKQQIKAKLAKRLNIQCSPYNGESMIFGLKLRIQESFVDYYILTESPISHTGVPKELTFNYSDFSEYANRIIYIPILVMPNLFKGTDLSRDQRWENQYLMRDGAYNALKLLARSQDIIELSDIDEIISKETIDKFDEKNGILAVVEQRVFFFYFNRRAVFDDYRKGIKNLCYGNTRILLFKNIRDKFKGIISYVRPRSYIVNSYLTSDLNILFFFKNIQFISLGGWHFSYVLSDQGLLKKLRNSADSPNARKVISNFTEQRTSGVFPDCGCYTKDLDLLEANLPDYLVNHVLKYKNESIYAPFFSNINFSNYNYTQNEFKIIRKIEALAEIQQREIDTYNLYYGILIRFILGKGILIAFLLIVLYRIYRYFRAKTLHASTLIPVETTERHEQFSQESEFSQKPAQFIKRQSK